MLCCHWRAHGRGEPRRTLLQIYGSYKYRRDLASAVHGPGILSRARALKRSEVETLSAPAGKGGAEVPLDPPSMRQAIAWELALRNIRKEEVSCSLSVVLNACEIVVDWLQGASFMHQDIQSGPSLHNLRKAEVCCRSVCRGLHVRAQCIWLWLAQQSHLLHALHCATDCLTADCRSSDGPSQGSSSRHRGA